MSPVCRQTHQRKLWGKTNPALLPQVQSFRGLDRRAKSHRAFLEPDAADFFQVFKQFGIYIAIFIIFGWISAKIGILVGIVFLMTALFFVPSMVILLVTPGSLIHALNPVVFVGLAFRIGWAYFLMNFFSVSPGKRTGLPGSVFHKVPSAGFSMGTVWLCQKLLYHCFLPPHGVCDSAIF